MTNNFYRDFKREKYKLIRYFITMKPPNDWHSCFRKYCSLFGGVRYSEDIQREVREFSFRNITHYWKVSVRRGFTIVDLI